MSEFDNAPAVCDEFVEGLCDAVKLIIKPKIRDLGGFSVRRVLPFIQQRQVGPFVFFDHMGPADIPPNKWEGVRSHPHIGLATITYLFRGEMLHKDSLGFEQVIGPGAINLMVAGKGIVHAEKARDEIIKSGQKMHGLQLWIGLPKEQEDTEPSFTHYPASDIPTHEQEGCKIRVMMGSAFGVESPVKCHSPTLYLEADLKEGASVVLPNAKERAIYVVDGELKAKDTLLEHLSMAVLHEKEGIEVTASKDTRFVVIGGDPIDQKHIFWNFVSSSKEKIEKAKEAWKNGEFPAVPGETDFIPLP